MGVNKAIILGNLTCDPELKRIPNGKAVVEFRVATNEKWTTKEGVTHDNVEYHNVKVFGKLAENCERYLKKGRQVYIEGKSTTQTWDDKQTGAKRYRQEFIANIVQFIGSYEKKEATQQNYPGQPTTDLMFTADDIPF